MKQLLKEKEIYHFNIFGSNILSSIKYQADRYKLFYEHRSYMSKLT
jgi:hypothetical protein